jgi:23S rRNA (guanine2445-N2)-methyltransferase / 23S rRNA (guanine2069-N7)-methyltransferase
MSMQFFATTPKGLELLLVEELKTLGASEVAEKLAGVEFTGELRIAYKACLWSRLANRILLRLARFPASTPEELYEGVQTIPWDEHLDPQKTLAVHFVSSQSQITHSLFGAQKVKDAIVDQMRAQYGARPSVAKDRPDVSIHVYLYRDTATISIDLSGESLHKRNYRLGGGVAPLKENLAAAILYRAGWPSIAKSGGALLDPMCGSGTLLIEAALIAGNIAPGLSRPYFGFLGWKQYEPALWQELHAEAKAEGRFDHLPTLIGYDEDAYAIKLAFENIERAGLLGKIHVEKRELSILHASKNLTSGLIVTNPPYGERLGEQEELKALYHLLGNKMKQEFPGWRAAVFTGNPELGKQMGIRAKNYYSLFNGPLPCKLFLFEIETESFVDRSPEADNERRIRSAQKVVNDQMSSGVEMFLNRLRKNLKHLRKQAKKRGLEDYRVYDADLPEYAFAIDIKADSVYILEYPAPKSVDPQKVLKRRQEVLAVLPEALGIESKKIFFELA